MVQEETLWTDNLFTVKAAIDLLHIVRFTPHLLLLLALPLHYLLKRPIPYELLICDVYLARRAEIRVQLVLANFAHQIVATFGAHEDFVGYFLPADYALGTGAFFNLVSHQFFVSQSN